MNHDPTSHKPARIDAAKFALDAAHLDGDDPLAGYRRLAAETTALADGDRVRWSADGALRASRQPWLHLVAETRLPMTCQRCLEPVAVGLAIDRWFRFVADEATAEMEDESAEEDVLALADELNLRQLVEDELLLDLPVVPMHDQCPVDVKLSVADPAFRDVEAPEHPFAALEQLRSKPE